MATLLHAGGGNRDGPAGGASHLCLLVSGAPLAASPPIFRTTGLITVTHTARVPGAGASARLREVRGKVVPATYRDSAAARSSARACAWPRDVRVGGIVVIYRESAAARSSARAPARMPAIE